MGITSSLFSGISGMNTNSNALSVIGDNIANENTIGFKTSRTTFQDVLAQSVATAAGTSQIGRGTALSSVDTLFQQGSFESTTSATDLAIGGTGYFIVRQPNTDIDFYTRAGQFRFDKDGNFVNPSGYVGRGWALDENGNDVGTIQDIVLHEFTSPPQATASLIAVTNLNSSDSSNSASLFGTWDGQATAPIADAAYGYQTAIRVYDSLGNSHDLTIYFDKCGGAGGGSEYDPGLTDVDNSWEYIVASNPMDDNRTAFTTSAARGILMRGTLSFNASTGDLNNVSAFEYTGALDPATDEAGWTRATFSTAGYPQFTAQFVPGVDQVIDLQEGLRNNDSTGGTGGWDATSGATVAAVHGGAGIPSFAGREPQAMTATQYASSSTTIYQSQNGYGTGFLENISVDTDGIMVGHYSNGQILNLYRVALAKFNNEQGLSKVGGNLWSTTRASGDAITGHAGDNGLGKIAPNSLEQSNVDLASEFVKMITTERGFQANSRIITTVDTLLQELINLHRG
jgi:flagellar hook protein FlgE